MHHTAISAEEIQKPLHTIAQTGRKMNKMADEFFLLSNASHTEVEIEPPDMVSILTKVQQCLVNVIEEYQVKIIIPPI